MLGSRSTPAPSSGKRRTSPWWGWLVLLFVGSAPITVWAQRVMPSALRAEYARITESRSPHPAPFLLSRPLYDPSVAPSDSLLAHPWAGTSLGQTGPFGLEPLEVFAGGNTWIPDPVTYGEGFWNGRGWHAGATMGLSQTVRGVRLDVRGSVEHLSNAFFGLSPYPRPAESWSPYTRRMISMDLVQRFGEEPITQFRLHHAMVETAWRGMAFGAGVGSPVWGVARVNPLFFAGSAPGFAHVRWATERPVETRFGTVQGEWIWGQLRESEHFDDVPTNNERFVTALQLGWSPPKYPALTVGVARTYLSTPPDGRPLVGELLYPVRNLLWFGTPNGFKDRQAEFDGDEWNMQMVGLFGRWMFPGSGLELYGERLWNATDRPLRTWFEAPEGGQAFTVGLSQTVALSQRHWLQLGLEATETDMNRPGRYTFIDPTYTHRTQRHGWTHDGVVLGAPLGPGARSVHVSATWYMPQGRVGLWAQRARKNMDQFDRLRPNVDVFFDSYETDAHLGLHGLTQFQQIQVSGYVQYSKRYNKDFKFRQDVDGWQSGIALRYLW